MLKILQNLIDQLAQEDQTTVSQPMLEQVTAALMIQLAKVDQQIAIEELRIIRRFISTTFNIVEADLDELMKTAEVQADQSISLYEFTSLIHQRLSSEQKYEIVLNLWRIAYADGHLDKYEEHFIRRAAELIYVPHTEFMRAKHEAKF